MSDHSTTGFKYHIIVVVFSVVIWIIICTWLVNSADTRYHLCTRILPIQPSDLRWKPFWDSEMKYGKTHYAVIDGSSSRLKENNNDERERAYHRDEYIHIIG